MFCSFELVALSLFCPHSALSVSAEFSKRFSVCFFVLQSEMKPPPRPRTTTPRPPPRWTNGSREDCRWVTNTPPPHRTEWLCLMWSEAASSGRRSDVESSHTFLGLLSKLWNNTVLTPSAPAFLLEYMCLWQCDKFHIFLLSGEGQRVSFYSAWFGFNHFAIQANTVRVSLYIFCLSIREKKQIAHEAWDCFCFFFEL